MLTIDNIGPIVIIIIIIYLIYCNNKTSKICNDVDHRCYNTVTKYNEQQTASNILAKLNLFSLKFLKHLRNKYIWNYHPNELGRRIVELLISNYNPDGIIENAPVNDVNTSYVDNKGEVFAICLREKLSGNDTFQNMHDLEFVVLHELTHMATETNGHGIDFWENFKFLLKEAKEMGIHNPVNYKLTPMNYCSLHVNYSPYFDNEIQDI